MANHNGGGLPALVIIAFIATLAFAPSAAAQSSAASQGVTTPPDNLIAPEQMAKLMAMTEAERTKFLSADMQAKSSHDPNAKLFLA